MTPKIAPCLWFAKEAQEAAEFYVSLLPDSRIDRIQRNPIDGPSGPKDSVLLVEFTLAGRPFLALNGGEAAQPHPFAVSFAITVETQAEIDRLWDALLADGGEPVECGWLRDRWGYPWQIMPAIALELLADPAKAPAVMKAVMSMVKLDVEGLKAAAG